MIRSKISRAILNHIAANYSGPVVLRAEDDDSELVPPCAVVRIGGTENIGYDQINVYDMAVLVGVFHDIDASTADQASDEAEVIFSTLADPSTVSATLTAQGFVMSAWQKEGVETTVADNGWQHVAGFRLIVSPA